MTALAGLRVIDLGVEPSAYCTRLLAGLGAEVIVVEPPEGSPARRRRPFRDDVPGPDRSLHFAHFNAGKKHLTLDLADPTERARLQELIRGVDSVVESQPVGELARLGLDFERLRAENPALVMTSISPYGQRGPKRDWPGTDLTAAASSGLLYITGEPDRPPTQYGQEQVFHLGSLYAAVGTLAALRNSRTTGEGCHVDISLQQAAHSITGDRQLAVLHRLTGQNARRTGNQTAHFFPYRNYPCADGWVTICALEPHQWSALATWIDEVTGAREVLNSRYAGRGFERAEYVDELHPLIEAFALCLGKAELQSKGQERGIPILAVSTVEDLAGNEQLAARNYFNGVTHPVVGKLLYPGPPYRLLDTPAIADVRAPLLHEHEREHADGEHTRRRAMPADRTGHPPSLAAAPAPLAGVRVVELGWYVAAPWVGLTLARLGAEVIKVETRKRIDIMRSVPIIDGKGTGADYSSFGGGKRSVTLDVRTPAGRELCLRLAAISDVFVENFSPGAIARFGLEYEALRAENPRIVMTRMPGLGLTGPYRDYVSYGLALQALSGLDHLTGFPDGPPGGSSVSYPDYVAALHATLAILAALEHRETTGEGQLIEVAQFESAVSVLGPAFLDWSAHARIPGRIGNAHISFAPHGVYRCTSEDEWIAVGVTTDEEWTALAEAIDARSWLEDDDLREVSGRLRRRTEIDEALEGWTASRSAAEAQEVFIAHGVPAAKVAKAADLLADEQLASLDYFRELQHPEHGRLPFASSPIRMGGEAAGPMPARELGADNHGVFCELLGLSEDELSRLMSEEVIC